MKKFKTISLSILAIAGINTFVANQMQQTSTLMSIADAGELNDVTECKLPGGRVFVQVQVKECGYWTQEITCDGETDQSCSFMASNGCGVHGVTMYTGTGNRIYDWCQGW